MRTGQLATVLWSLNVSQYIGNGKQLKARSTYKQSIPVTDYIYIYIYYLINNKQTLHMV